MKKISIGILSLMISFSATAQGNPLEIYHASDFPKPAKIIQFDNSEECYAGLREFRISGEIYKIVFLSPFIVVNGSYIINTMRSCQIYPSSKDTNSIEVWKKSDIDQHFSMIRQQFREREESHKNNALDKIRQAGL